MAAGLILGISCTSARPGSPHDDGGECNADHPIEPNFGACAETCAVAGDCTAAPGGTAPVACEDEQCILDCSTGETCPDGMVCSVGACTWKQAGPGYADCGNNPDSVCLAAEACIIDDTQVPNTAVCAAACTAAAECAIAPATGDAAVACGDIGAGGDVCYLDCSGGEACPTGMVCSGGTHCTHPDENLLLSKDWESGALTPGWTLNDVDGQTHNAGVAFVTGAFKVGNFQEADNFAAYSASWYNPVGQSDDWLISPQITLGAASVLSWVARAPDQAFADGYSVLVSTGPGTDPADFLANAAVFEVAAELGAYTPHSVDLAAAGYANEPVFIAFRNNSVDRFLLLIDNIEITE